MKIIQASLYFLGRYVWLRLALLLGLASMTLVARADGNVRPVSEDWCAYDSNGNVILLTDEAAKPTAHYQYDAFGKTLTATGPAADSNPYRFSTKPIERDSGLAFYGYRYYAPELGRWPCRDPILENGGVNLYGFVANTPMTTGDVLGLDGTLVNTAVPLNHADFPSRCIPRSEAEHLMYPNGQVPTRSEGLLDKGCIGLCKLYQGLEDNVAPEKCQLTGCYLTGAQAGAKASKCPKGTKPFYFLKQGVWKDGKEPTPISPSGLVQSDVIVGNGDPSEFNYVTFFVETHTFAWMNRQLFPGQMEGLVTYLSGRPQEVCAADSVPEDQKYPNQIYCVTCQ